MFIYINTLGVTRDKNSARNRQKSECNIYMHAYGNIYKYTIHQWLIINMHRVSLYH